MMAERRLTAVLFDLDGLLAATEPLWIASADEVLGRRGVRWDQALREQVMGRPPLEVARFMVEHFALEDDPEALMNERLALQRRLYETHGIAAMPGGVALVEALVAEGIPRAIASGSPSSLVDESLRRMGLSEHFPVALGSDQVARGKPAPDVFLASAAALGVDPRGCVVLEDADNGVAAALAAEMICVKVLRGSCDDAGAHRLVESLEMLDVPMLRELVASRP